MRTFKEFLTEAKAPGSEPLKIESLGHLSDEKLFAFLKKNCSEWMYLFKTGPFWRGDRDRMDVHVVDTSKSMRVSQNTFNYGTLLMDEQKGWPKRGKSLICTTDQYYAADYGSIQAIIPFNKAKVAVVNSNDMFDCAVEFPFFNDHVGVEAANSFINAVLLTLLPSQKHCTTIEELKQCLVQIAALGVNEIDRRFRDSFNSKSELYHALTSAAYLEDEECDEDLWEEMAEFFARNALKNLIKVFDHTEMEHSIVKPGYDPSDESTEAWIEGKMVVFTEAQFDQFKEYLEGRK